MKRAVNFARSTKVWQLGFRGIQWDSLDQAELRLRS